MNGRIYDPRLGRFLQADPFVPDPTNSQSFDRFSYVFNNPLSYTDPSGFIPGDRSIVSNPFREIWFNVFLASGAKDSRSKNAPGYAPEVLVSQSPAGVLAKSIDRQAVIRNVESFTRTDTAAATVGQTYSEETGGKFANGGDSATFWEVISANTPEILYDALSKSAVFIDQAFGVEIGQSVLDVSMAGPVVESVANVLDGDAKGAIVAAGGLILGKFKAAQSVSDILKKTKAGRSTKGRTTQRVGKGGFNRANKHFEDLGPADVRPISTKNGPGRTGTLHDGSKVTVKPGSSDGRPTLEIRNPKNNRGIEIRYDD